MFKILNCLIALVASAAAQSSSASASAVPSTAPAATDYAFTCPEGLLTYYVTVDTYPGIELAEATAYFGNWSYAIVGPLLNVSGYGEPGATRTYGIGGGLSISEELTAVNMSSSTGSLNQISISTAPVTIANITLYNFTNSLTIYTNTTTNETTVQDWLNGCLDNQSVGIELVAEALQAQVSGWYSALQNMTSGASASASAMSAGITSA